MVSAFHVGHAIVHTTVKHGGGHVHHGDVDEPGHAERDHDIEIGEANEFRHVADPQRHDSILSQAGMKIDYMRHDRCADDADGQQYAVGTAKPGNHSVIGDLAPVGPREY